MKYVYVPGCALMCYKPELAIRLKQVVESVYGQMDTLLTCCFDNPALDEDAVLITPCTTCDKTYRKHYPHCGVRFFLEELAESDTFPFPDYGGAEMSLQDTCSGRTDERYLNTVRKLLQRMNICLVEAEKSGKRGKCCGQVLYNKQPLEKVEAFMKTRAGEMPCQDVVVYCASCIQAIQLGGKRPRFLLDLLFDEPTNLVSQGVESWNRKLLDFRKKHSLLQKDSF